MIYATTRVNSFTIFLKCNLFMPWCSWRIAHLAVNQVIFFAIIYCNDVANTNWVPSWFYCTCIYTRPKQITNALIFVISLFSIYIWMMLFYFLPLKDVNSQITGMIFFSYLTAFSYFPVERNCCKLPDKVRTSQK